MARTFVFRCIAFTRSGCSVALRDESPHRHACKQWRRILAHSTEMATIVKKFDGEAKVGDLLTAISSGLGGLGGKGGHREGLPDESAALLIEPR